MSRDNSTKFHNRLWQARKRARLGQKQVARLLGHHTTDQVSRYESGQRVPVLETALRLEIILHTPVRVLFPDLYRSLKAEVQSQVGNDYALGRAYQQPPFDEGFGEYCTHKDRMRALELSAAERDAVRRHVTELARLIANS